MLNLLRQIVKMPARCSFFDQSKANVKKKNDSKCSTIKWGLNRNPSKPGEHQKKKLANPHIVH